MDGILFIVTENVWQNQEYYYSFYMKWGGVNRSLLVNDMLHIYNNIMKDGEFLFLLLWVSRYYAIIRPVWQRIRSGRGFVPGGTYSLAQLFRISDNSADLFRAVIHHLYISENVIKAKMLHSFLCCNILYKERKLYYIV